MKPLLILSLLAIWAGCDGPKKVVVRGEEAPEIDLLNNPQKWRNMTTSTGEVLQVLQPSEFDDVLKAMRILAAHADPSPQVGTVNAVLLPLSESLMLAAKRQEAREAEYAWAKSVLAELEKRK